MAAKGPLPGVPPARPQWGLKRKPRYQCNECEFPSEVLCHCGIGVGTLQLRNGVLCKRDEFGRCYVGAPRRADVALAQRMVAAIRDSPEGSLLASDVTSVRED